MDLSGLVRWEFREEGKSLKKHINMYKTAKVLLKKNYANFHLPYSLMKIEKYGMLINGK
jgi:hypothetical protein